MVWRISNSSSVFLVSCVLRHEQLVMLLSYSHLHRLHMIDTHSSDQYCKACTKACCLPQLELVFYRLLALTSLRSTCLKLRAICRQLQHNQSVFQEVCAEFAFHLHPSRLTSNVRSLHDSAFLASSLIWPCTMAACTQRETVLYEESCELSMRQDLWSTFHNTRMYTLPSLSHDCCTHDAQGLPETRCSSCKSGTYRWPGWRLLTLLWLLSYKIGTAHRCLDQVCGQKHAV